MANTYTQIHIHVVFAVQNRASLISESWEMELHKYMSGIIQHNNHKVLAINGTNDHIHILFGFRPTQSLSDLMQDVKGCSSKWINQRRLCPGRFSWQEGYGGFSYSKSQLPKVARYIENQKQHHQKRTFCQEYLKMLRDFEVEFDGRYIFKPIE